MLENSKMEFVIFVCAVLNILYLSILMLYLLPL